MRRFITFINILLGILIGSCNSEAVPTGLPDTIGKIQSRGIITDTALKADDQALFNSTGGLSLTDCILTYNGKNWENEEILLTPNSSQETSLTAFHPAYNSEQELITQVPYSDNALEDVLMAQCTFTNQTDIELKFKHLFSLLTFHVQPPFQESLSMISLTMPKVESIDTTDGSIHISGEHTTRLNKNENGDYAFIVPPGENRKLTITFTTPDGEISHALTHTFASGHKYECNVTSLDTRPGIRNAEDLITLSQFINDPANKGKFHPDFGEKTGDEIVYRLLADITLTEKDCNKFAPIGSHKSTPFNDTFDGEGHTISNFILPDKNTEWKHSGLFGYIESNGIVQNIKIDGASTISDPTCTYIGIITGSNYGIINNCSVTNSTIHSNAAEAVGLICAITTGVVINCYSQNNSIHLDNQNTYAGAISGSSETRITNCYSNNNKFYTSTNNNHIGGITGMTSNQKMLNIRNCYVYHTSNNSNWYAAIGLTQSASIRNFYYNTGELYEGKLGTTPQDVIIYDSSFKVDNIHISELLNQWIDTTGKENYSEYTFRRWTTAADGSPCFE